MVQKGEKNLKFPRGVILIVIFQYSFKFCYNALRGTLPLYLVDILKYEDDEAVVFYHAFSAFGFTFSIIGGILADSLLGKFKSIVIFGIIFTVGLISLSATAAPPVQLPIRAFTILSMLIAALGHGVIKPCIVAFGGNQFILPDQEKQLSLLFIFLSIVDNLASMSVSFVTPLIRKDFACFGELTCYSLAFIVPAALIAIATVMILATKRLYRIHKPVDNTIIKVIKCAFYAIFQRSKIEKNPQHWLYRNIDKYETKLIQDIKSVSSILKLLLPLSIFWSLFLAQSSLWVFQASRMDGEIGGYVIRPDQIQLVNALSVLVFIPIFHSYVYPFLAKFFAINTLLKRITVGCFTTAIAYYVSGVVEWNLEATYAKVPTKALAQMRLYNTLDCKVPMAIDEQKFVVNELDFWKNIDITTTKKRVLKYEANFSHCNVSEMLPKNISGLFEVIENQAKSWAITENGLSYKFIDHINKSNNGNPLVRNLIFMSSDFKKNDAALKLMCKGQVLKEIKLSDEFKESEFEEVTHDNYDLYVNNQLVESNVPLKLGGVYTILGHVSNSSAKVHTVTVTQPNSLHILWVLPQQILLAVSEIMVSISTMEFAYSQAPTSMKTFLQSFWSFLGFFGNVIIIAITESHFFERKVFVLFLYAILMTISAIIFWILASFHKQKELNDSDSE